jgi:LPXTG-motif cell wall-anchored protein
MKKANLILSFVFVLIMANAGMAISQETPKPKKDTVNADTYAKPQQYYAVEDEKSSGKGSTKTIVLIAGAAVIVGATVFFMLKKKKK